MSENGDVATGVSGLPKLKGSDITPDKALIWFRDFEAYATTKKYDAALEGEANLPIDSDTTTDDAALKARARNKLCMAALVLATNCIEHLPLITS
eukprot:CAMPEP_0178579538 /NCGR_PEP_ID=MMETSP0697-20121206/22134_1 /TAXON_ID=265572 /ORGANISM="Extubocellulus spinifer, Strain CCMP396" /LENGTH=94 /DNA_ID=CAMNT_0020214989 /DNA_START=738 /DNA_END=1019 /DNA_ORIENTATION=-